ncbi:unnamed protein product [Dovyalis caffra]|uniref:HVA22-like protein n=1 Tax=Dovyalis caffra TaxID=77055 RepID=A0AAV1RJY0_9ROSI|nr:unnamed protein product [Dovyalis caffra]
MGRLWTFLTHVHTLSGPVVMLLYPLYASVVAIESPSREDDEQWLAYWILYSFLTLAEMLLQSILQWIPIWYSLKLALAAWLVLPQFNGAAFIYERFVREHIRKYIGENDHHPHHKSPDGSGSGSGSGRGGGKGKSKFVHFISSNKLPIIKGILEREMYTILVYTSSAVDAYHSNFSKTKHAILLLCSVDNKLEKQSDVISKKAYSASNFKNAPLPRNYASFRFLISPLDNVPSTGRIMKGKA